MVDKALPKADRIEFDDDEQAAIDAAAGRLMSTLREEAAKESPPRDEVGALITLDAKHWRRLANSTMAAPPLVDRVLKAIRANVGKHTGNVTIAGSLHGWNALLSYMLDRGICCDVGAMISSQMMKKRR